MKTRIIYTDLWESEAFHKLNTDAQLLYLYLLTSPKIGLITVFKAPDRTLEFHTGFDSKRLKAAQEALYLSNFAVFYEGWVHIASNIGFVASNYRGENNEIAKNREIALIPEDICRVFGLEISEYGLGVTQSYVKSRKGYTHLRVAEEILERKLDPDEIVHHIDFNKANNDPENLCVMTIEEHNLLHNNFKTLDQCRVIYLGRLVSI